MAAPVFESPAPFYDRGELWPEAEPTNGTVSLDRSRSLILRELPGSLAVRNSVNKLQRVPDSVPKDLDRFCCFLETNAENGFAGIVEKLGRELHKLKARRSLGIVSMEEMYPDEMAADVFPVPEVNSDPVIAQIRGWFVLELGLSVDDELIRNLHEIDLRNGMPEGDGVSQVKAVFRVVESAARELLSGIALEACPAAKALGYREPEGYRG